MKTLTPILIIGYSEDCDSEGFLLTTREECINYLLEVASTDSKLPIRARNKFGWEKGSNFKRNLQTLSQSSLEDYLIHYVNWYHQEDAKRIHSFSTYRQHK